MPAAIGFPDRDYGRTRFSARLGGGSCLGSEFGGHLRILSVGLTAKQIDYAPSSLLAPQKEQNADGARNVPLRSGMRESQSDLRVRIEGRAPRNPLRRDRVVGLIIGIACRLNKECPDVLLGPLDL